MKGKILIRYIFIVLLVFSACSEDDNPVSPSDITSDAEILGPNEEDYDFYVGISYSDPQPADSLRKKFYVIISCEDSLQAFRNVKLKVQEQNISLQYANYFGKDFYIAYFTIAYEDNYNIELSVNGNTVIDQLEILKEINIELPQSIPSQQDLKLQWETEKNPQVQYVEAFQMDENNEFLVTSIKNIKPEIREFTIPSSWLWGNSSASKRAVQIGTMNYVINKRVCFTISDGIFKIYE